MKQSLFSYIIQYARTIQLLISGYPVAIIWWATSRCDARCPYCENLDIIKESPNRRRDELTAEELGRFSQKYGKIKIMAIGGGEPTLRTDLFGIVDKFYLNNGLEIINLYTNGFSAERLKAVAEGIAKKCPAIKLNIFISIDAIGEKHDRLRGVKGGFDKAVESIEEIKRLQALYANLYLTVTSVFSCHTQDSIEETYRFFHDRLGVPYSITIHRETKAEIGEEAGGFVKDVGVNTKLDIDLYKKLVDKINADELRMRQIAYPLKGVKDTIDKMALMNTIKILEEDDFIMPCQAIRRTVTIADNGDVYACEIIHKPLGNLRDFDFDLKKLMDSKRSREMRKWIKDTKCYCAWEGINRCNLAFNLKVYPKIVYRCIKDYCRIKPGVLLEDSRGRT